MRNGVGGVVSDVTGGEVQLGSATGAGGAVGSAGGAASAAAATGVVGGATAINNAGTADGAGNTLKELQASVSDAGSKAKEALGTETGKLGRGRAGLSASDRFPRFRPVSDRFQTSVMSQLVY